MDATILRLNRDMIARFRGWLSMLSYEGGKSGGPALRRSIRLSALALLKILGRSASACLHRACIWKWSSCP